MSTTITVDNSTNQVKYVREFHLSPFSLNVFPQDMDRFCIVIIGEKSLLTKKILTFVLNTFMDEKLISPTPGEEPLKQAMKVIKELSDLKKDPEEMKKQLAIIDLTSDNHFNGIHPSVIRFHDSASLKWQRNMMIKKILFPNSLTKSADNYCDKNFSHTIWLAEKVDEVPQVLSTNSHLVFLTVNNSISEFFMKKLGLEMKKVIEEESMLVLSSTLKPDLQIMSVSKQKFLC